MKDYTDIPECTSLEGYDEILITGGEPLIDWLQLQRCLDAIESVTSDSKIYIYTATTDVYMLNLLLRDDLIDGCVYTLHEPNDVTYLRMLNQFLSHPLPREKSLRLNIFKGIYVSEEDRDGWIVKDEMEWIEDCPLPEGEVLQLWKES